MNVFKPSAIVLFFILFGCFDLFKADEWPCGDWEVFKDEKCFKILDDTLRVFADAEKACAHMEHSPSLAIIRSQEEQEFLTKYAFKIQKRTENIWIGARVSHNKLTWADHSNQSFTNWQSGSPRNKPDYCVEMRSDELDQGKWVDEPCNKKNLVICQRKQIWSLARIQQTLLDTQKEMRHRAEEAEVKHHRELLLLKQTLEDEMAKRTAELKQHFPQPSGGSSIPLGFTYVQLPHSKAPGEIWPSTIWTDISSNYSGVFFRVVGDSAAAFGQVQEDNSPRLDGIKLCSGGNDDDGGSINSNFANEPLAKGKSSKWIYTGDDVRGTTRWIRLSVSGGEVRPRNMAMRVWERTG